MRRDREYIEFKVEQAWGATKPSHDQVRLGMDDALALIPLPPEQYHSHIETSLKDAANARQWGFQFTMHLLGMQAI